MSLTGSIPERVECPHAERCAGCPLIGASYPEQLVAKRRQLRAAIERFPHLRGVEVEPTVGAARIVDYRGRAKLVVASGPAVGLYARGTHDVVDIPECRVLSPALRRVAAALRGLLLSPPRQALRVLSPAGPGGTGLSAVDLREALDEGGARVLATLVVDAETASGGEPVVRAARAVMAAADEVAGVALSARTRDSARVLGSAPRVVAGESELWDTTGEVRHIATHGAFVQAHREQAAELHAELLRALERRFGSIAGLRIYDLFGGSGAIGLALVRAGAEVTLVESYAPAVEAARRAGLEARVADAAELAEGPRPDVVVVNPPRRGLRADVRRAVARLAPRAIVYVSCSPDTLARDLSDFALRGYSAERLVPFDMIPLSDQVETLAIVEPGAAPTPTILLEHAELLAVDKPPFEAATAQSERGLLDRVRALPGWEESVLVLAPDPDASGIAIFARAPAAVDTWSAAVGAARRQVIALVRGMTRKRGTVRRPSSARDTERAATRYQLVGRTAGHSLLHLEPESGRMGQIRRHMAGIGHPVVGDARQGHAATNRYFAEKMALDRCFLHLSRVELIDPCDGHRIVMESPVAPDLALVLARLADSETAGGRL